MTTLCFYFSLKKNSSYLNSGAVTEIQNFVLVWEFTLFSPGTNRQTDIFLFAVLYKESTFIGRAGEGVGGGGVGCLGCNTIPYNTIQYNAMQCHAMQYKTIQYNTIQCHAMPCHAMPCHTIPCHAMQCNAVRCDAVRCGAIQCKAKHYLSNRKRFSCVCIAWYKHE